MLVNFSAKARPDDGRPRTPAFIESLHCDVMANGPARTTSSIRRSRQPLLLLPNRRDCRLEGMDAAESSALTIELWKQIETLPAQYHLPLRDRTLVMWDNIACVHDNPAFPRDRDREVWFLNVLNDRPIEPLAAGLAAASD